MEFCRILDNAHLRRMLANPTFSPLAPCCKNLELWTEKPSTDGPTENEFSIAIAGTQGAAVLLRQRFPYDRQPLDVLYFVASDPTKEALLLSFIERFAATFLHHLSEKNRLCVRPDSRFPGHLSKTS